MSALTQYIIVRKDLKNAFKWPYTSVIGQCVHAVTAIIQLHEEDDDTQSYLKNLENMNKIVLGIEDEAALEKLANNLKQKTICYLLWKEPPNDVPTCIAIKPMAKESLQEFVKDLEVLEE